MKKEFCTHKDWQISNGTGYYFLVIPPGDYDYIQKPFHSVSDAIKWIDTYLELCDGKYKISEVHVEHPYMAAFPEVTFRFHALPEDFGPPNMGKGKNLPPNFLNEGSIMRKRVDAVVAALKESQENLEIK